MLNASRMCGSYLEWSSRDIPANFRVGIVAGGASQYPMMCHSKSVLQNLLQYIGHSLHSHFYTGQVNFMRDFFACSILLMRFRNFVFSKPRPYINYSSSDFYNFEVYHFYYTQNTRLFASCFSTLTLITPTDFTT